MTDYWKSVLAGNPVDPEGKLSLTSVETVARALYDEATLDWPINEVPPDVAEAAKAVLERANAALGAMARLAEVSRARLIERGDVQSDPLPVAPKEPPAGHLVCRTCSGDGLVVTQGGERTACPECDGGGLVPDPSYTGPVDRGSPADIARRSSHRPER